MKSKKVGLIERESLIVATRGQGVEQNGEMSEYRVFIKLDVIR
jgi:hypothetical protein